MYISIDFLPSNISSIIKILKVYIHAADPAIIIERYSEVKVINGMDTATALVQECTVFFLYKVLAIPSYS